MGTSGRVGSIVACTVMISLASCGGGGGGGGETADFTVQRDQSMWEEPNSSADVGGGLDAAQTLTVGLTGELRYVAVELERVVEGDLRLEVRPLDGDAPRPESASILRQTLVDPGTVPATAARQVIHLEPPLPVTAGDRLALCLRSRTGLFRWSQVIGGVYPGGTAWWRPDAPPNTPWSLVGADRLFETFVAVE